MRYMATELRLHAVTVTIVGGGSLSSPDNASSGTSPTGRPICSCACRDIRGEAMVGGWGGGGGRLQISLLSRDHVMRHLEPACFGQGSR